MDTTASQGASVPASGGTTAPSVASLFEDLSSRSMPIPGQATPVVVTPEAILEGEDSQPEVPLEKKDHKTEDAKEDILAALKGVKKPTEPEKKGEVKTQEVKNERVFKLKQGEEELSLKPDAVTKVKVDGKEVEIKLQELVDNYSGKTNWSKKYQDLAEDKKALQESINGLYDKLVKQGDALGAIEVLAEALGGNPLEARKQVKATLIKQLENLASLSPEEREVVDMKEELSWHKRQKESERATSELQAKRAELQTKVDKVQETYGLTTEDLVKTYEELRSLDVSEADLEANPDLIGQYHKAKQTRSGIDGLLKEIEADFESEPARTDAVERLAKVMQLYPDMTLTELRDYALEAYGSKQAKNISRKLKKSQPVSTVRTAERKREPVNFDDID